MYRKEGREGNAASLHNCAGNRTTFKKTVALPSYFSAWSGRKLCPSQWAASMSRRDPCTLQGQQKELLGSLPQGKEGCKQREDVASGMTAFCHTQSVLLGGC